MTDTLRNKLIVGVADNDAGQALYAAARHVSANATALTVQAPQVVVGSATTSQLGFFGAAVTSRAASAAVTDYLSLKVVLQNYGLIGS
jgi:hypothetical protein